MMTFQIRWVLLAATAALVGCTSQEQIARQDAIPPYPEPYRAQLQQEFLLMADKEAAQNDHLDAKRFSIALLKPLAPSRSILTN